MFKLNIAKKSHDITAERKISQGGIEMTLTVKKDADFETAFAHISQHLNDKPKLTKDSLKRGQDGMGSHEALLFVIGEYVISDWNIDVDGSKFAINGDNLMAVIENAFDKNDDVTAFVTLLVNTFGELVKEYGDKVVEAKKKPSTTTNSKDKGN